MLDEAKIDFIFDARLTLLPSSTTRLAYLYASAFCRADLRARDVILRCHRISYRRGKYHFQADLPASNIFARPPPSRFPDIGVLKSIRVHFHD